MKRYVLRRLALAVPTLILVSVIVFSMMRLMPGDVVIRMVEGHAYAPTIEALRKELGLDRPAHVQYVEWIGGILLRGDFGDSYWTRQPIFDEFVRRFPVTLELAALTILVSVIIGILVGIVSAVRQDTVSDYVGRALASDGEIDVAPGMGPSRDGRPELHQDAVTGNAGPVSAAPGPDQLLELLRRAPAVTERLIAHAT